jgi:threonine/homoserine/homoserine lactone efflux protein
MDDLFPMVMFSLATTMTPGPNNFMILNSGLSYGVRRSLPHYFGICFGFPAMVLLVALGLGVIFLQYAWLEQLLKVVGSAYMLYLAWCMVKSSTASDETALAKPFSFMQALLFQWVNPKAWMMAIGAISIFSTAESHFQNALLVSTIFLLVCLPCIGLWLVGGAYLQNILKNAKQQRCFNILMAIALVASMIMMI